LGRIDGYGIRLGGSPLAQVLGSGVRSSCLAAQYAAILERMSTNETSG
jgi:hypothetical protein